MTVFPLQAPVVGLAVSNDALVLVETSRRLNRVICREVSSIPLPAGTVHLSPARPNIVNAEAFGEAIQRLTQHLRRPQPVALSLPDLCARTAILTFSSFPHKRADQQALVAWRLQQDLHIVPNTSRLAYRVYNPPARTHEGSSAAPAHTHVFVAAIPLTILEPYEQACLDHGLLPTSVGLAGLDLFHFYQTRGATIDDASTTPLRRSAGDWLSLYVADWGFCCMAFHDGYPTFIRVKPLSSSAKRGDGSTPAPSTEPHTGPDQSTASSTAPADHSRRAAALTNELLATLQYYFDSLDAAPQSHRSIPLYYLHGAASDGGTLPNDQFLNDRLTAHLANPCSITTVNYTNIDAPNLGYMKSNTRLDDTTMATFASVAVAT